MKENKYEYTEGEWKIKKNGLTNIIGTEETDVCDVHWCHKKYGKANARLISCAPEMIKALIDCVGIIEDMIDIGMLKIETTEIILDKKIKLIEKALNKKWSEK